MPELEQRVQDINPGVYTFWPHPARQIEANTGLGKALTEAGQGIDKAARLGVEITEKNIEGDVDRGVDRIRDDYTKRLQTMYDSVTGQGADKDLFDQNTPSTPETLQKRLKAVDALDAAKSSGKYSETYLMAQYVDLAKQLRSQYPAFRDYIDQRIDHSTGRGVANRYVASLLSDLNSFVNNKQDFVKESYKAVIKEAQEGNRDLVPLAMKIMNNDPSVTPQMAMKALNETNAQKFTLQRMKEVREGITGDITMRKDVAQREAAEYLSQKVANWTAVHQGLISRLEDDSLSTQERQQIAESIIQQGESIRRDAIAEFNKRGLTRDLGEDWQGVINKNLEYFTTVSKWMADGNFGPIKHAANLVQAKKDDVTKDLFESDLGTDLAVADAVTKAGGGPGTKLQERLSEMERARNLDQRINTFVTNQGNKILGQVGAKAVTTEGRWDMNTPSSNLTPQQTPVPSKPVIGFGDILKNSKDQLDKAGIQSESIRSKIYGGIVRYFDIFKDKTMPTEIRENVANAAFSKPWISTFDKDTVDPSTGAPRLGQSSVFAQFTDPSTDKAIFASKDPQLIQKYINWKTNEFSHVVFRNEINDINKFQNVDDLGRFGYNDQSHTLVFEPNRGRTANVVMSNTQSYIDQTIKRLNMGLTNMASLAKYTKVDPNTYIMQALNAGGLNDGPVYQAIRKAVLGAVIEEDKETLGK